MLCQFCFSIPLYVVSTAIKLLSTGVKQNARELIQQLLEIPAIHAVGNPWANFCLKCYLVHKNKVLVFKSNNCMFKITKYLALLTRKARHLPVLSHKHHSVEATVAVHLEVIDIAVNLLDQNNGHVTSTMLAIEWDYLSCFFFK